MGRGHGSDHFWISGAGGVEPWVTACKHVDNTNNCVFVVRHVELQLEIYEETFLEWPFIQLGWCAYLFHTQTHNYFCSLVDLLTTRVPIRVERSGRITDQLWSVVPLLFLICVLHMAVVWLSHSSHCTQLPLLFAVCQFESVLPVSLSSCDPWCFSLFVDFLFVKTLYS